MFFALLFLFLSENYAIETYEPQRFLFIEPQTGSPRWTRRGEGGGGSGAHAHTEMQPSPYECSRADVLLAVAKKLSHKEHRQRQ